MFDSFLIQGKKPDALYKVKDPEVRQFVEKCLATVTLRLSARELLKDHFLQTDDYGSDLRPIEYQRDLGEVGPLMRPPHYDIHDSYSSFMNEYLGYPEFEPENGLVCHPAEFDKNEIDLFNHQEDEHLENVDISIKGRKRDDQGIFLRIRISDKEGSSPILILLPYEFCIIETELFMLHFACRSDSKHLLPLRH